VAFGVPSISKLNGFTATFHCFPAGTTWSVTVWANQLGTWKAYLAGSATIAPGTNYSKTFGTPTQVLTGQTAYVRTCNSGTCYSSAQVTVGL
jgi:hypothetical protein